MSPRDTNGWEDSEPAADEGSFDGRKTVITKPTFLDSAEKERAASRGEVIPIKPAMDPLLKKLQSLKLDRSTAASAAPAPPRSWKKWILLAAAAGVAVVVYPRVKDRLDHPPPSASTGASLHVLTVVPTVRTDTTLTAAGYIAAQDLITVGVTTNGRVSKVLVANGDLVKQGQLLVQLDDSELRADLRLAGARLHDAQRNAKQLRNLVKAEAATQVDFEKAVGQVEVSRAEVGVIYPRIKQLQIRAPVAGSVIEVLAEPGEVITTTVGSTVGVVKMADLSRLVVETDVNEADISLVRMGDRAEVTVESFPDQTFSGKVVELAGQADRTKGTLIVKVQLSDPKLRPGLSARVRFQGPANPTPRMLIPKTALQQGAVWRIEDGRVRRRPISSRSAGANVIEVVDGLQAGDRIISAGGQSLADGDRLPDSVR